MGYSICISRIDNNPITLSEWLEVIENDKELKFVKSKEGINPITKQKIIIEVQGHAVWRHTEEKYDVEFYYHKGKVCMDDYDEVIVNKMRFLAKKLHAKVLDEFDEEL